MTCRVTRARGNCYAAVSVHTAGTADMAVRGSRDERFERIEWILREFTGRTRQLIFVPRLPAALNKPAVGRLVSWRDVIFRRK